MRGGGLRGERRRSLHVLVDGLTEVVDGLLIALLRGFDYAVLQVILQYELAGVVDGAAHGGNLNQHFGAIAPILHHAANRLQMPDGAGEAVEHRAGMLVGVGMVVAVGVFVGNAVFVHPGVVVRLGGRVDVFVGHACLTSLSLDPIYFIPRAALLQAPRRDKSAFHPMKSG